MKIIFKIARAELRTLFYSPIAWIVIVAFFVVSGLELVKPLMNLAREQEIRLANSPLWEGYPAPLTLRLFESTLFKVISYLFLFLPLITMGTFSREVGSGTFYLLGSSPVRTREIVLGKYLGLQLFNLALLSGAVLILGTGFLSLESPDPGWFFSMLLAFFLLSSAYLAIGLFISCLTSYQILAGVATYVTFALLRSVGYLWQEYDFVRDLTWFLSIANRTEIMLYGLITTRDLLYFVLIVILFLGLAIIRLKSKQESAKWTVPFMRNLGLFALVLMLGYYSSRPGNVGYWDMTKLKHNTIDTATQSVLKELDGSPITVTAYVNLFGRNWQGGIPSARNKYIYWFWDKYLRFYPNVRFKYEYFYDVSDKNQDILLVFPNKNMHEVAVDVAKIYRQDLSIYQKPEEIQKKVNLRKEPLTMIMDLEYKGKTSRLLTYVPEIWPDEPNVSAAVRRLTRDSMPSVYFLSGHYERSPFKRGEREYGGHATEELSKTTLLSVGFRIDTISLRDGEIHPDAGVLVVGDPKSALDPEEQEKIMRFISGGGNVLFYGEHNKQQMLNPILNQLGVNLEKGVVVSPRKDWEPGMFRTGMTPSGMRMARERNMQIFQQTGKGSVEALFDGFSHITYTNNFGFDVEPIVTLPANKNTWIESGEYRTDTAAPVFNPIEGDIQKDEYVLAVKLTRNLGDRQQRIVVASDADFMSRRRGNGRDIGLGLYSWLSYNDYPVYKTAKIDKDRKLSIGRTTGKVIYYAYVYVVPALLLIAGSVIVIRRKRK